RINKVSQRTSLGARPNNYSYLHDAHVGNVRWEILWDSTNSSPHDFRTRTSARIMPMEQVRTKSL
ncbi:MAG: hypothetical protein Greene041662_60, partial [Candidatus Peregrinibacteria bacterium Greene0416_62]